MIKLAEILHTIKAEHEEGCVPVDSWKITDADFMMSMGFTANGMCHFALKNPEITVAYKTGVGFIIDDKTKKEKYTAKDFNQLMDFFSNYQQKFENEPYKNNT
jgi:hypothetical protein